ncbi:MAG: hypothetical protein PT953_05825 [Prevotella sp.]|nr:hypothetical protein [Prevotella sp.]
MLDKDYYWCYNHENLFREWLTYIYKRIDYYDMDNATIFDLWQEAKKYALEIANAKKPDLYLKIIDNDIITNFNHHSFMLWDFLYTMLVSIKNKNLELFAYCGKEAFKAYLSEKKIDVNSIDKLDNKSLEDLNINMVAFGQIESDYDYSLPDGGITETITDSKTITETKTKTDETITKTKTKTKTDETITKTITKTESVDVILPEYNALNNDDFISAMRKAIEKGWIEIIEKGKYKWIGPTLIGTKKIKGYSNAALAYFIAKALKIKMELNQKKSLTETSKDSIKNNFPPINDIKEVFGEEIKRQQLEDALGRNKVQGWRKPIDEFFEDIYNFIGN